MTIEEYFKANGLHLYQLNRIINDEAVKLNPMGISASRLYRLRSGARPKDYELTALKKATKGECQSYS